MKSLVPKPPEEIGQGSIAENAAWNPSSACCRGLTPIEYEAIMNDQVALTA